MRPIRIKDRPPDPHGLCPQSNRLHHVGAAPDPAVNHDVDLVEEVGAEGPDLEEDVDGRGCVICLTASVVGLHMDQLRYRG
jgi:hypothetical protein